MGSTNDNGKKSSPQGKRYKKKKKKWMTDKILELKKMIWYITPRNCAK